MGASFGGVSAALAAARAGRRVVLSEETGWIGGQATAQGVPLDEDPWIERFGTSESYRQFRRSVRAYYRRHYPMTAASRSDRAFNPGAGWVSALCSEPKLGRAVLEELLAPYVSSGRVLLVLHHCPAAVETDGDLLPGQQVRPRAVRAAAGHPGRSAAAPGVELEWPHRQPAMSYHSYRVQRPDWHWGESARNP